MSSASKSLNLMSLIQGDRPTIRAMVVDDDPMMAELLRIFLAQRGYLVEHCPDGQHAIERLRSGEFNLVLTDRKMPRMDGLQLSKAIREMHADSYVYCIMLTASGEQESLVAAMEAGVDDFVAKPLNFAELGARLHAAERVIRLESQLARRNAQIADAYGQLQRDLELARTLQLSHLPAPRRFGRFEFCWRFEASRYVGGDTFDYFAVGTQHLCFYLADVSGHGVASAMMAFHAQHQLRASSQEMTRALTEPDAELGATAVAIVTEANRRFLQMNEPSLYLTMLFGLLDVQTGAVALVQAGHPPALLSGGRGAEIVGRSDVPLGILETPGYQALELQLAPGDRLVLYSDGASECADPAQEQFGLTRMRAVLDDHAAAPLPDAIEGLHHAVLDWRAGMALDDDFTVVALEAH